MSRKGGGRGVRVSARGMVVVARSVRDAFARLHAGFHELELENKLRGRSEGSRFWQPT